MSTFKSSARSLSCAYKLLPGLHVGGGCLGRTALHNPLAGSSWLHSSSGVEQAAQPEEFVSSEQGVSETRLVIDEWGAVSSVPSDEVESFLSARRSTQYANHDGQRFDDGRYRDFILAAREFLPGKRVITDPLKLLAFGGDASFYRLLPKAVLKVHNEEEVRRALDLARRYSVPVTFRAAGTSLSGQAITDSVLIKMSHVGKNFRRMEILDEGKRVKVEPALLGGDVNRELHKFSRRRKLPYTYRIGPDPASIDSAMIGGIVANNSSGMCCGVDQNTYKTLDHMRLVLVDGTVLDTADPDSCSSFLKSHPQMTSRISQLAEQVQGNPSLSSLIRNKYKIKNTVGYTLNALVDFDPADPINIMKHLMVGSEGTLGFISNVTYNTVQELPHKASAFVLFPDITSACEVVLALRSEGRVPSATELCDYASLRLAREELVPLVPGLSQSDEGAAALLVEVKGVSQEELEHKINSVQATMRKTGVDFGSSKASPLGLEAFTFRKDPKEYSVYWDFRKGLIPIIGGSRGVGTSMLIEDVVCPPESLAGMTQDLIDLMRHHGYTRASTCGHALDGNLHLVFAQGFRTAEEVAAFGAFLQDMAEIVAVKYKGSLKGEHGTGRNMAPFLDLEWGREAVAAMAAIKDIFDPQALLNPGVILNKDPRVHMYHLKPSPPASPIIDHCMECGYCEAVCPSRDVTITPRQRITTFREINRLAGLGEERTAEQTDRMKSMAHDWQYNGDATCAADGMCGVRCPVNINTGEFTKQVRAAAVESGIMQPGFSTSTSRGGGSSSGGGGSSSSGVGAAAGSSAAPTSSLLARGSNWVARHFGLVNDGVPLLLHTVSAFHRLLGPGLLEGVSGALNRWTNHLVPVWNPFMPKGGSMVHLPQQQPLPATDASSATARQTGTGSPRRLVYFPTCVTRMMGPALGDPQQRHVGDVFVELANKAGYQVIIPQGVKSLCCGMMFDSRGAKTAAGFKYAEVAQALLAASELGTLPIIIDNSPCYAELKAGGLAASGVRVSLFEPVAFTRQYLAPHLDFSVVRDKVAVHVPCTSKQAGLTSDFVDLAQQCAAEVIPSDISCCGMAGDRGLRYPELTQGACASMELPPDCKDGYSTSRTCEIGLSNAGNIHFRSILHLVNEATRPRPPTNADQPPGELPTQQLNNPSLTSAHRT